MDIMDEWGAPTIDTHDVNIGTNVAIRGILEENGGSGVLIMTRKSNGWEQRGRWNTSHLHRDYVNGERLDYILEHWTPHDFKSVESKWLIPTDGQSVWGAFEDEELTLTIDTTSH